MWCMGGNGCGRGRRHCWKLGRNGASILAAAAAVDAVAANVAAVQAANIACGAGPGTWIIVGHDGSISES